MKTSKTRVGARLTCDVCRQTFTGRRAPQLLGMHKARVHGKKKFSTVEVVPIDPIEPKLVDRSISPSAASSRTFLENAIQQLDLRRKVLEAEISRLENFQLEMTELNRENEVLKRALEEIIGTRQEVSSRPSVGTSGGRSHAVGAAAEFSH